jgi:hypothetical protein
LKDSLGIGEDIKESVQRAISSGDFSDLNRQIKDTISTTVNEALNININSESFRPRVRYSSRQGKNFVYRNYDQNGQVQGNVVNPNNKYNNVNQYNPVYNNYNQNGLVRFKKSKSVSGNLQRGFGWFFGVMFGITLLSGGVTTSVSSIVVWSAFMGLSVFGIFAGQLKINNINNAKRYYNYIKDREYIDIAELARMTGESVGNVTKNLEAILKQGIFPDAHFDASRSTLILNNRAYRNYIEIEEQRRQLEVSEKIADSELKDSDAAASLTDEQKAEWISLISEGEDYIRKLRKLNDDIPGEIISQKLDNLEKLLKEIFARVKVKPEESSQMKKFMEYYLPTTVKLVDKYKEFDKISFPSNEIINAKTEIENTLDTINQAFIEMLNNLFKNDVYDASSDAQVLTTMLAKEGLTKDEISGMQ